MNTFGSKLNEYLDILGITQVKAAQVAGCSRAMIYSVLNDERNLSEDKFQTMLAELPFSETQADVLRKLYYADKYPKGVIEKIYCIKNYLSGALPKPAGHKIPKTVSLPSAQTAVDGEREICDLAAAMIGDEDCRTVYTNFSYRAANFDGAVYAALCKRKTPVNFQHILCFESSNRSTVNIQNIFESVRYIRLRHSPLYYYVEDIPRRLHVLYPHFLVTEKAVLLFHEKLNIGLYLTEPTVIQEVMSAIRQFLPNCKPLAHINETVLDLQSDLMKAFEVKVQFCLSGFVCDLPHAPYDYFDALASPDLPNREMLIEIARNYYSRYSDLYHDIYIPLRAVETFAKEGMTLNFPQNWIVPLPYEYRIGVLKNFRDRLTRKTGRVVLLNDSLLQLPDKFWGLDVSAHNLSFFGSISEDGSQYAGEFSIFTNNRSIIADFRFYMDFVMRNKLYCSPDYAAEYIDSLILQCEQRKNEQDS